MTILILTAAFVIGLVFGSFLNVCIHRIPRGESILTPRSHCPACGTVIRWYDNIPVLSYVTLRGHCRHCHAKFAALYPVIELATATWFALCFLPVVHRLSLPTDELIRLLIHHTGDCALGFLLIGLCVIDWQHYRLPDVLTLSGIAAGLTFACLEAIFLGDDEENILLHRRVNITAAGAGRSSGNIFLTGAEHLIFSRLAAAVLAFLLLYLINIAYKMARKRDGMGLGDAKLLAMIGSFIGFAPTGLAFAIGIAAAMLYSVSLLVTGKANSRTAIPFGSLLCFGGLVAALTGTRLIDGYLSLFH